MNIDLSRDGSVVLDPHDPGCRLSHLLDQGSMTPLHDQDGTGARAARGSIDGNKVFAYCTDARKSGGAMTALGCQHIVDAIDLACLEGKPVIGLWHSGGAMLTEGVMALDGVGSIFAAIVRASGLVPQISVVLGPAAGGAAYGPALTDVVLMSDEGRVFVTGPSVVKAVTGEEIDMAALGGPDAHSRRSGVAHMVASGEAETLARARKLICLFSQQDLPAPGAICGQQEDLRSLLPEQSRRAYDVRVLIDRMMDDTAQGNRFEEFQPRWAPNVVVGMGRLAGGTVGVVANNPLRKAGCLDSLSAEKAARFVRMCDSFGIPLVVIADVPGYLPGVQQEWDGVVRRGAKLLHAFAACKVPRVTLITRKAYGGAYIAMNSHALGASTVFAWPDAEIAVMGAEAAVDILHKKRLANTAEEARDALKARLIAQQRQLAGDVGCAVALGVVDEVIQPAETRRKLAEALAAAPTRKGTHDNIPL
jgi:acetyl-CoA/propionyl-CoA carboxylase carboxyl transferase subunit